MSRRLVYLVLIATITSAYVDAVAQQVVAPSMSPDAVAVKANALPDVTRSRPLSQTISSVVYTPAQTKQFTAMTNSVLAPIAGTPVKVSNPSLHDIMQSQPTAITKSTVQPAKTVAAPVTQTRTVTKPAPHTVARDAVLAALEKSLYTALHATPHAQAASSPKSTAAATITTSPVTPKSTVVTAPAAKLSDAPPAPKIETATLSKSVRELLQSAQTKSAFPTTPVHLPKAPLPGQGHTTVAAHVATTVTSRTPAVAAVAKPSAHSFAKMTVQLPATFTVDAPLHATLQSTATRLAKSVVNPAVTTIHSAATMPSLLASTQELHVATTLKPGVAHPVAMPTATVVAAAKPVVVPAPQSSPAPAAPTRPFAKLEPLTTKASLASLDVKLLTVLSPDKMRHNTLRATPIAMADAITPPATVATMTAKSDMPNLLGQVHAVPDKQTKPQPMTVPAQAQSAKRSVKMDVSFPEVASLNNKTPHVLSSMQTIVDQSIVKSTVAVADHPVTVSSLTQQASTAHIETVVSQHTAVNQPVVTPAPVVAVKKPAMVTPIKPMNTADAKLPEAMTLDKALHEAMEPGHAALARAITKPGSLAAITPKPVMPLPLFTQPVHHVPVVVSAPAVVSQPSVVTPSVQHVAAVIPAQPIKHFAKVATTLPTASLATTLHDTLQSTQAALARTVAKPAVIVAENKAEMPALLADLSNTHVATVITQAIAAPVTPMATVEPAHPLLHFAKLEPQMTAAMPLEKTLRTAIHEAKQSAHTTLKTAIVQPVFVTTAELKLVKPPVAPLLAIQKPKPVVATAAPHTTFAKLETGLSETVTIDRALHDAMQPVQARLAKAVVKPDILAAANSTVTTSLFEHVPEARVAAVPAASTTTVAPAVAATQPVVTPAPVSLIMPSKRFEKRAVNLPADVALETSLRAATQPTRVALASAMTKPTLGAPSPLLISKTPVAYTEPVVTAVAVPVSAPAKSLAKLAVSLPNEFALDKALHTARQKTSATLASAIPQPVFVATAALIINKPPVTQPKLVTVAVASQPVTPVKPAAPATMIATSAPIPVAKAAVTPPAPHVIVTVLGTRTMPLTPVMTVGPSLPLRQFAKVTVQWPQPVALNQALLASRMLTNRVIAETFAKPGSIVVAAKSRVPALLQPIDVTESVDRAQLTKTAMSNLVFAAPVPPAAPEFDVTPKPQLLDKMLRFMAIAKARLHEQHFQNTGVMLAVNNAPSLASVTSEINHHAHFKPLSSLTSLPVIPVGHHLAAQPATLPLVAAAQPVEMAPAPGSLSAHPIPVPKIVAETRASTAEAIMPQYIDHERAAISGLRVAMENTIHTPEVQVSNAIMGDLAASMVAMAHPHDDPLHQHSIYEDISGAKSPMLGLRRPNTFSVPMFDTVLGVKGVYDAKTKVYKLAVPRDDLNIIINGVRLTSAMGLTSWVTFKNELDGTAMKGSLVLTEEQVNPVILTAIENGINVTDLHNHYLWETPKVVFMHIEAVGDAKKLAKAVSVILDKMKDTGQGNGDFPLALIDTANTTLNPGKIEKILGVRGGMVDGVYKIRVAKQEKRTPGQVANASPAMTAHTAVTFAGADDGAVMDGNIALRESQLQQALLAFQKAGISIVAIHQRTMGDDTHYVFLHYWGVGKTEELAHGLQAALQASIPS